MSKHTHSRIEPGRVGKALLGIGAKLGLLRMVDAASEDAQWSPAAVPMTKGFENLIGTDIFIKSGIEISPKTFKTFADNYSQWVYTAVNKKAQTVATLPFGLYSYKNSTGKYVAGSQCKGLKSSMRKMKTKGERARFLKAQGLEKVEIPDHPFIELMQAPNTVQPRMLFMQDLIMKLELSGAAPVYMQVNRLGQPVSMFVLPLKDTGEFKVLPDEKLVIGGYQYTDGTVRLTLKPEEVMYIHYPSPASVYEAYCPLLAQTYPYDIDLFLSQYQYAMFKNKTNFGNVLTTDEKLTQAQVEALKTAFDAQKGAINSGKAVVFHSGLKPADKLALSMEESMIDVVADYAQKKILSSYGTPPGKVGIVTDVNRANMEALDHTYYQETIMPTTMLVEEYFETQLLPRYDERLTLDFELPDTRDRAQMVAERKVNLETGYSTINEERQKDGMDPVEWGDAPFLSFGLTQWSPEREEQQAAARQALADRTGAASEDSDQGATDKPNEDRDEPEKKKTLSTNELRHQWKAFDARERAYEAILVDVARKHFRRMVDPLVAYVQERGNRIRGQINGWSRKKVDQWFAKADRFADLPLNPLDDANQWAREFARPLTKIMHDTGEYRLQQFVKQHLIPTVVGFNVNDPEVQQWLGRRLETFSAEVAGTTFDDIRTILREGFAAGDNITTITQTLRDKFGVYDRSRALTIARTETVGAMNAADLMAVEQEGLGDTLDKIWLVADDEARDSHLDAAQKYSEGGTIGPIPLDEYFEVGADRMQAPGTGTLAGEVCNCRCSISYTPKQQS